MRYSLEGLVSALGYAVLLYTLLIMLLYPIFTPAQAFPFSIHAGYNYMTSEPGFLNYWGVKGSIRAVDFVLPWPTWAAMWVSAIFTYYPQFSWVQAGYYGKWGIFGDVYKLYVEFYHPSVGYKRIEGNSPRLNEAFPAEVFSMSIFNDRWIRYPPQLWKAIAGPYGNRVSASYYLSSNYEPIDLLAMVEISDVNVDVPLTYIGSLKLYKGGWKYWDQHTARYIPPLYLWGVSHYAFHVFTK